MAIHPLDSYLRGIAWDRYVRASARVSLVDCSSFVLMEELGLTEEFAFDEDFEKAGFKVLRAD